jgi:LPS sulfotransferase NodH
LPPQITYVICATPRTGSTLLCEALTNTGLAGEPDEYFAVEMEERLYDKLGVSTFAEYLPRIVEEHTSPNGVFGTKLMMTEFYPYFMNRLRAGQPGGARERTDAELLTEVFPNLHYIWITRRNKVRQAVSLSKAIQTRVWEARINRSKEPLAEPKYRFEGIDLITQRIVIYEAQWQDFFTRNGIKTFNIIYEDFVDTYEETALQILKYIGVEVPPKVNFWKRKMVRQADKLSEEWVERFMRDKSEQIMREPVGPDTQW